MAEEANPNQVRENEPADLGYAPPDTGQGDAAESEVPAGVDALSSEQVQAAEERGGGSDDGGDSGALDVSAVMGEGGDDADASADDAGDAEASGGDVEASADEADAEAEGTAADDAGEDATERTDADAQVAPDTGDAG